jgi:hypothetical protein
MKNLKSMSFDKLLAYRDELHRRLPCGATVFSRRAFA